MNKGQIPRIFSGSMLVTPFLDVSVVNAASLSNLTNRLIHDVLVDN